MCHMFAHQPQENYQSVTRSIRIGGHITSVRLENTFWTILEEIAASEGSSVAKFITTLHDEVLDCRARCRTSPPCCAAPASSISRARPASRSADSR